MRTRNVKNKKEIIESNPLVILEPKQYKGKWQEKFNNNNPIHIEIGMGKGQFIRTLAIENPNINYIGIERSDSVLALALKNIPQDITNLILLRMDANDLEDSFNHEVDTIYLNFSDPWPKKRHAKRRLTSQEFLKVYETVFKKDAHIIQKTDNYLLFEYSLEQLSKSGYIFNKVNLDLHKDEEQPNIKTEYEEKFSKKGFPIYRLDALKRLK